MILAASPRSVLLEVGVKHLLIEVEKDWVDQNRSAVVVVGSFDHPVWEVAVGGCIYPRTLLHVKDRLQYCSIWCLLNDLIRF